MSFSFNISSRPTISEIHELYRTGKATVSQVTECFLERIKTKNPELNAFYKTTEKIAREQAAKMDLELKMVRNYSEENIKNLINSSLYGYYGYNVIIINTTIGSHFGVPSNYGSLEEWKIKFKKLNLNVIDLTTEDKKEENQAIVDTNQKKLDCILLDIKSNYSLNETCIIVLTYENFVLDIFKKNSFRTELLENYHDHIIEPDIYKELNKSIDTLEFVNFNQMICKFPLFGIPFATKAIIQLEGEIFNASSKIMDGFQAPFSATVIEKILESGAILVGITNMDQWAMGSSGESSDFGNIKNPFDLSRTPGGSSSGAAASVASGQVVFSLGTDTGGSIRQPAAFCDVVGLKPTYGLVSRWGVMPMASSLDQVGAITNTVADNMLVNKILAGKDQKDQTTIESGELITKLSDLIAKNQNETAKKNLSLKELQNEPNRPNEIQNPMAPKNDPVMINLAKLQEKNTEPSPKNLENINAKHLIGSLEVDVESTLDGSTQSKSPLGGSERSNSQNEKKFKIGLPREFYVDGIDPIIRKALTDLQNKLIANGHEMVQVDLPLTKYAVAVYYMTMGVEVASNLERIDGVRYGRQGEYENLFFDHRNHFGAEAKRRIMLGTYASSSGYYDAFYNQAQKVRELARLDFDTAFESCDLILTPTTPEFAFKLGSKTEDPLKMYLSDVFTCGINPVRIPGLSVPLGLFDVPNCEHKLPTGCQILAPELKEDKIYTLALEIEEIVKSGNLNQA